MLQHELDVEKQATILLQEKIKQLEFRLQEKDVELVQQKYGLQEQFQTVQKQLEQDIQTEKLEKERLTKSIEELKNKIADLATALTAKSAENMSFAAIDIISAESQAKIAKLNASVDSLKMELETCRMKLLEQMDDYQQLFNKSKTQAQTIERLNSQLAQLKRDIAQKTSQWKESQYNSRCYSQLLKITLIQRWIKEYRRKKNLLQMLAEFYNMSQTLFNSVINDRFLDTNNLNNVNENNNLQFPVQFNLNKRKNELTKLDSILGFYIELGPFFTNLVAENCAQKQYWKATAESFFNRTIQLKQQLNSLQTTMQDDSTTQLCLHKLAGVPKQEKIIKTHLDYLTQAAEPELFFSCSVERTQLKLALEGEECKVAELREKLNGMKEELQHYKQQCQQLILLDTNNLNSKPNSNEKIFLTKAELENYEYEAKQNKALKKRIKEEKQNNQLLNTRIIQLMHQIHDKNSCNNTNPAQNKGNAQNIAVSAESKEYCNEFILQPSINNNSHYIRPQTVLLPRPVSTNQSSPTPFRPPYISANTTIPIHPSHNYLSQSQQQYFQSININNHLPTPFLLNNNNFNNHIPRPPTLSSSSPFSSPRALKSAPLQIKLPKPLFKSNPTS